MSTNLGNILVGLGYDLSALEKGAPEAFRLINQQTLGMSAEMKRTSREGAESFRLIDEALGIHISRPLTRLLTQEFPSLAKGLASVLGVGVVGALGVAGIEFIDKIAQKIEKAERAQEAFAAATQKTKEVFADAMAVFAKDETLRSLSGTHKKLFEVDYASIEEGRKKIDQLAEALEKEAKAAADANSPLTSFLASLGEMVHVISSLPSTIGAEEINTQLGKFIQRYNDLGRIDALNATHYSASAIETELDKARTTLATMQNMKISGADELANYAKTAAGHPELMTFGFTQKEIDAQNAFIEGLRKIQQLQTASDIDKGAKEDEVKKAAALEARHEQIRELQGDLKGINDASVKDAQTWDKINDEIEKAVGHLWDFNAATVRGSLDDKALPAQAAHFAEFQKLFGSVNQVAPPAVSPQRTDLVELEKITNDQTEAWKKAQQVIDQIETPMQKYNTQLQVLKTLQQEGRLTTQQLALAQQQLGEEFSRAQLRVMAMEQELEKLLRNSTSAKDGMHAFLLQLNLEASRNGTFTFDLMNKGLQGFEDETAKALTGAKTNWASFFESLDQMALKFLMNKLISQLLNGLGSGGGIGGFFSSLFGGGGGGGGDAASAGSVGSFIGDLSDSGIGAFASGTDSAPGGMAWVGENGPELMNVPAGASITPNSALRAGGHTMIVNIDAKGAELGVETKIARALQEAGPSIVAQAVAHVNEIQRRTPH